MKSEIEILLCLVRMLHSYSPGWMVHFWPMNHRIEFVLRKAKFLWMQQGNEGLPFGANKAVRALGLMNDTSTLRHDVRLYRYVEPFHELYELFNNRVPDSAITLLEFLASLEVENVRTRTKHKNTNADAAGNKP